MLGPLIATPHRSAVCESLPVLVFCFGDWQVLAQRIHGRETVLRLIQSVGDVEKELEKAFHFFEVAEVMKGGQRKVGVTQPTVAVVPASSSSGLLGQTARHRGEDRARVFVTVEFEDEG